GARPRIRTSASHGLRRTSTARTFPTAASACCGTCRTRTRIASTAITTASAARARRGLRGRQGLTVVVQRERRERRDSKPATSGGQAGLAASALGGDRRGFPARAGRFAPRLAGIAVLLGAPAGTSCGISAGCFVVQL